jgi:glutamate-1-semialdehyde 2,1-aminomutase
MQKRSKSETVANRLASLLPGGVNSPVRSFSNLLKIPLIAERGEKEYLFDIDGNKYIDFIGSWGAFLHGHNHPAIREAIEKQLVKGIGFGLSTEAEERIAEHVVRRVPSIEKIRFLTSGTEATMTAIRLARAFTKKKKVVKFAGNYHGHSDLFLSQSGSGTLHMNASATSAGVLPDVIRDTITLPYNDVTALEALFQEQEKEIACAIVEPVAGNMGVCAATPLFLHKLREKTAKTRSLLIFDEVITGFRLSRQGAQGIYPIRPDLTCFGKIIGGGLAASAVGGREEIMDQLAPLGNVYQAGTLSGNPLAMAAGLASLQLSDSEEFYIKLNGRASAFAEQLQCLLQKYEAKACLNQVGSMFTLFWGAESVNCLEDACIKGQTLFHSFYLHMLSEGILLPPSQYEACFISNAHSNESLEKTLSAFETFLAKHAPALA